MPNRPITVVNRLEHEWQPLLHGQLREAFPDWRRSQPALRRFDQPGRLLSFLHGAPPCQTDQPLRALLELARYDVGAGRFVLQAILPALKLQAERLAHRQVGTDVAWELLLLHAWAAIRTFPCEDRPRSVAANLVLQVWHDTTRELDRCTHQPHTRPPAGDEERQSVPARRPLDGAGSPRRRAVLTVLAATRAGAISRRDATLILRSRIEDVPLCLLARQAGVPYQSLLKRRQRAEQRLREWRRVQGNVRNRREKVLTCSGEPRQRQPARKASRRPAAARRRLDLKERL